MKIPFTIVRYFSRKNTPKRGRSGSVPKPKNKGKAVAVTQVVVVKGLIPVVAEYDLDNPSEAGYAIAVEAVTKSLLEVRQMKSALELGDVLRFVRYTYRKRSVEALVNRKAVKLLAVKAGVKVIVLEKEEKFGVVADYLMKMEGLNPEEFLFFGRPVDFPLSDIPFSLGFVRDEMMTLFEMDRVSVKKFENAMLFDRLFCLFVLSSVVLKWKEIFSGLMRPNSTKEVYLSKGDVNLWTYWVPISDFICSGGVTKLPEAVNWLDLSLAESLFSVLMPSEKRQYYAQQYNAKSNVKKDCSRGYHTLSVSATHTPFLYASASARTASATRTPFLYASASARTYGDSASATRAPFLYASASARTSGDSFSDLRPSPVSRMATYFTPSTPMPLAAFAGFLSNFKVGSVFRALKQFPK